MPEVFGLPRILSTLTLWTCYISIFLPLANKLPCLCLCCELHHRIGLGSFVLEVLGDEIGPHEAALPLFALEVAPTEYRAVVLPDWLVVNNTNEVPRCNVFDAPVEANLSLSHWPFA